MGLGTFLFWMLVSYGLCFGIANKATFLHGKARFLDALISCSYCLGFHTGWMTWLMALAVGDHVVAQTVPGLAVGLLSWSLASSTFCYSFDVLLRKLE